MQVQIVSTQKKLRNATDDDENILQHVESITDRDFNGYNEC